MRFEHNHNFFKFRILEVYFESMDDPIPQGLDIVKFIQCAPGEPKSKNFITNIIFLTQDLDTIKSNFKKTLRYDVNKAYRHTFQYREVQDTAEVKDLQNKLDVFLKSRKLPISNKKKISDFVARGFTYISVLQDIDTGLSNYHFYIRDDGSRRARLWYSFGDEFTDASYDLNKVHIFEDLAFFKAAGMSIFDLGGVSSVTNPSGIDKFKLAYSGDIDHSFTGSVGTSLRGRILLAIYNTVSKYRFALS